MSSKIQITAALTLALFLGVSSASQLKVKALNEHLTRGIFDHLTQNLAETEHLTYDCDAHQLTQQDYQTLDELSQLAYEQRHNNYNPSLKAYVSSTYYFYNYLNLVEGNFHTQDAFNEWANDTRNDLLSKNQSQIDTLNYRLDNAINGYDNTYLKWNTHDQVDSRFYSYYHDYYEQWNLTAQEGYQLFNFLDDLLVKVRDLNVVELYNDALNQLANNCTSQEDFDAFFEEFKKTTLSDVEEELDQLRKEIRNHYNDNFSECQNVTAYLEQRYYTWMVDEINQFRQHLNVSGCLDYYSDYEIMQNIRDLAANSSDIYDFFYYSFDDYKTQELKKCEESHSGYNYTQNDTDDLWAFYQSQSYEVQQKIDQAATFLQQNNYDQTYSGSFYDIIDYIQHFELTQDEIIYYIDDYLNQSVQEMIDNHTLPYCYFYDCNNTNNSPVYDNLDVSFWQEVDAFIEYLKEEYDETLVNEQEIWQNILDLSYSTYDINEFMDKLTSLAEDLIYSLSQRYVLYRLDSKFWDQLGEYVSNLSMKCASVVDVSYIYSTVYTLGEKYTEMEDFFEALNHEREQLEADCDRALQSQGYPQSNAQVSIKSLLRKVQAGAN